MRTKYKALLAYIMLSGLIFAAESAVGWISARDSWMVWGGMVMALLAWIFILREGEPS